MWRVQSSYISALAFSPDGKFVVTGSWDNDVIVWNAETGAEVRIRVVA